VATTTLTSAQIQEHGLAMFKAVLLVDPDSIVVMLPILEDYPTRGTIGTIGERRDAVRLLLNYHWKQCLHHPYEGHTMKHYYQALQDVPDLEEPTP
jgi:hypothetical protein